MQLQRRALLKLLALAVAAPAAVLAKYATVKFAASPFQLGVASGAPSPDGFVLWTRLVGPELTSARAVGVAWEVFDLNQPHEILATGQHLAMSELAHSVHIEVSGLAPDKWYGYRFRVGSFESTLGRARTLPSPDALPSKLRFAYASCQKWEVGFYAAYRHMLQEQLDLVVFVGDYIYGAKFKKTPGNVRMHTLHHVHSLNDYRARYALYKSDPHLQRMHAYCPWLTTWDDHEVQNDYAGNLSIYDTAHFSQLRAAAYQAYYEHMPIRTSTLVAGLDGLQRGAELRIYDRVDFGRLAAFHILDDRQYRDAPLCPKKTKHEIAKICTGAKSSRSMLGKAQEDWLNSSFTQSAAHGTIWNIITQQTRFTPINYHRDQVKKISVGNWDGYSDARQRLLDSMQQQKLANPIVVGGNIHQNWVARIHHDPYDIKSPMLGSEFCGTSITSLSSHTQENADHLVAANPHCLLNNPTKRGYGVVNISPDKTLISLRVLDDARNPNSEISTLASFAIESGKPEPVRVS